MGDILSILFKVITVPLQLVARFAYFFYVEILPFILKYIAIPMFVLGILLALSFAGGTIIFTIIFFIMMYFFIKGTLFDSKPKIK